MDSFSGRLCAYSKASGRRKYGSKDQSGTATETEAVHLAIRNAPQFCAPQSLAKPLPHGGKSVPNPCSPAVLKSIVSVGRNLGTRVPYTGTGPFSIRKASARAPHRKSRQEAPQSHCPRFLCRWSRPSTGSVAENERAADATRGVDSPASDAPAASGDAGSLAQAPAPVKRSASGGKGWRCQFSAGIARTREAPPAWSILASGASASDAEKVRLSSPNQGADKFSLPSLRRIW